MPPDRAEILQIMLQRLEVEKSLTFSSGAVVECWRPGGAIQVIPPAPKRPRTFGPTEVEAAYQYAMGFGEAP